MALTPERMAELDQLVATKKQSSTLTPERMAELDALVAARQVTAPSTPVNQANANNPVRQFVQGVAKPFLRTAAAVPAVIGGVSKLAQGDVAGASEALTRERNFGVLGSSRPIGINQQTGEAQTGKELAGDVLGTGLQIGSYLAPAGVAAKAPLMTNVAKSALFSGAGAGIGGAGTALSEGKGAGEVLGEGLKSAGVGLAAGAAFPLAGAGMRAVKESLPAVTAQATKFGKQGLASATETAERTAGAFGMQLPEEKVVKQNLEDLRKIRTGKTNVKLNKIVDNANRKGIKVEDDLARLDLLSGIVDENGTVLTQGEDGTIAEIKNFLKHGDGKSSGLESVVRDALQDEGAFVSIDKVRTALTRKMKEGGLNGAELVRGLRMLKDELNGLRLRANKSGLIPLEVLHDAKIGKYDSINFLSEDNEAKRRIAGAYKELVEKNSKADIKAYNKELSRFYTMIEYLEALHGKKVEGGRLGKYFARTIGAIAGAKLGPLGSIVSSEVAGKLQGKLMAGTFAGKTGRALEVPPILAEAVAKHNAPKAPPLRIGWDIKTPPPPDTSKFATQKEAQEALRARGWQNVGDDQSLKIPSGNNTMATNPIKSEKKYPISETLAQLDTKDKVNAEIAKRIEAFRDEAGFKAEREGAGVVRRNVEDAAGNFQFQSSRFSLNKAKSSMYRQAENYKKEAHRLLYENDPDFRAIVDKGDTILEEKVNAKLGTVTSASDAEFLDLINEVNDEIAIANKYGKPYEGNVTQPKTPPTPPPAPKTPNIETPKPQESQVINE